MGLISDLFEGWFGKPPCGAQHLPEVEKLSEELLRIGKTDDFLSERPGAGFNSQCRHVRTRAIGKRLFELGGVPLMEFIHRRIRRKLKRKIGEHLEYAWDDVGEWKA